MKRIFLLSLLTCIFCFTLTNDAFAQGKKKNKKKSKTEKVDKYFDESGSIAQKLWYGGSFNLGFNGNGQINIFNIGVSPMVGYKIIDNFSVGPRVSFQYTYVKGLASDLLVHRTDLLSYSAGLFARYKFFPSIFAHLEYEYENDEFVVVQNGLLAWDNSQQEVVTGRESRDNAYIGAGFNSGVGDFGYEIVVLYNVLTPASSVELPFSLRFGLTYRF